MRMSIVITLVIIIFTLCCPSLIHTQSHTKLEDISGFWEGTFTNTLYYSHNYNVNNNIKDNNTLDVITGCTDDLSDKCRDSLPLTYFGLIIDANNNELHSLINFDGSTSISDAMDIFSICAKDGVFPAAFSSSDTKFNIKYDYKNQFLYMTDIINQKQSKISSCNLFEIYIQNDEVKANLTQIVEFKGKKSQMEPVIKTECHYHNDNKSCEIKYTDVEHDITLSSTNTVTLTCMKGECLNLLLPSPEEDNDDDNEMDIFSDFYAELDIASLISY